MRIAVCLLAASLCLCYAGDKKTPLNDAGNDNVDIHATLLDGEQIKKAVGVDLPDNIRVVAVQVSPKTDTPLAISADDFIMLSHRDGQRATCYTGSQIAGNSALVVKTMADGSQQTHQRIGLGPFGVGGGQRQPKTTEVKEEKADTEQKSDTATDSDAPKPAENPLVTTLDQKRLPDKTTTDPLSGLMYFQIDGKQKTKDLELIYKGPAGRLVIAFPDDHEKKK